MDLFQVIYDAASSIAILFMAIRMSASQREFARYRDQANMFMAGMYNLAEKTEQTPGMP